MLDTEARLRAIKLLTKAMQRYKDKMDEKCKSFQSEEEHIQALRNGEFDNLIDVDRIRELAAQSQTLEEFAEAIENEQLALDRFNALELEDESRSLLLEKEITRLFGSNKCEYLREYYHDDLSCIFMGTAIAVAPFVVNHNGGFNEMETTGLQMALQDSKFAYGYVEGHSISAINTYSDPEWHPKEYFGGIEHTSDTGRKVLEAIPLMKEKKDREPPHIVKGNIQGLGIGE